MAKNLLFYRIKVVHHVHQRQRYTLTLSMPTIRIRLFWTRSIKSPYLVI